MRWCLVVSTYSLPNPLIVDTKSNHQKVSCQNNETLKENLLSFYKRQKGESQNGCFKKAKHAKFPKNKHFLPPDMHTYVCVSGGKKCLLFGNFDVFAFLKHPFFALLPYYRRFHTTNFTSCFKNLPQSLSKM